MNIFALVAAYSREEAQANLAALETRLTPEEIEWLDLRREGRR